MNMLHISAYKFVQFDSTELFTLQKELRTQAAEYSLKGTILLSEEGANFCLAGLPDSVQNFKNYLQSIKKFANLTFKESTSDQQPYKKLLVKIKKEIITLGMPHLSSQTAPYVTPQQLKELYEEQCDMVMLDTRNNYEVQMGTFEGALQLDIKNFQEFPQALAQLPEELKQKTIVTFCTGGIRCEKAVLVMQQQGFKNVYQLQGGILNYFKESGDAFYEGDCFVFDERLVLDSHLQSRLIAQCIRCRNPLKCNDNHDAAEQCLQCSG